MCVKSIETFQFYQYLEEQEKGFRKLVYKKNNCLYEAYFVRMILFICSTIQMKWLLIKSLCLMMIEKLFLVILQ